MAAYAENGDTQSIYLISDTVPMTVSSASTRTAVLPNQTRAVRIVATTNSHIKFGGSSVAATSLTTFIPAYTPETFKIQPTDGNYLAIIQDSGGGSAFIDLMKP
jgi:hypothetical protein